MRSPVFVAVSLFLVTACAPRQDNPPMAPGPQESFEEKLDVSLFAPPSEQKLRREHALASELAETLRQVAGVTDARVHLYLADNSLVSRNPDAQSRAAILVTHAPALRPSPSDIRKLAAAALPDLAEEQVAVVFTAPPKPETTTEFLGPLEIASSSMTSAKVVFGALLCTCLLMALFLIAAGLKIRRMRRTTRE